MLYNSNNNKACKVVTVISTGSLSMLNQLSPVPAGNVAIWLYTQVSVDHFVTKKNFKHDNSQASSGIMRRCLFGLFIIYYYLDIRMRNCQ